MKYKVEVRETQWYEIEVEADNELEAMEKVQGMELEEVTAHNVDGEWDYRII